MAKLALEEALEAVLAERIRKEDGYCELPTPIFVGKIDVNMPPLPSAAFYLRKEDRTFELLKNEGQGYSPLALSLHETVWVRELDMPEIRSYLESIVLTAPAPAPTLPPEKRMQVLRRSALLVVEDLFQKPTPENIDRSKKVVSDFVYVLMRDPKAYMLLAQLSSHDPYTLQHSVGTAINCVILARKLGVSREEDLMDVGLAGLLHDIGKVHVKKEIINKPGPLDDLEWEEMRQHSAEGYEIVRNHPGLSELTKRAILEHHEDRNGTGYPLGLKGDQIHLYSRIVCLCDIFNALTTDRTYSKARTAFDAFQFIREKMSHKVDEEAFKQLVLIYGGKI